MNVILTNAQNVAGASAKCCTHYPTQLFYKSDQKYCLKCNKTLRSWWN